MLTGNARFVDPDFKAAYDWMVAQMQARLGTRPPAYPIWVWPKRPDLRHAGPLLVLLECRLDPAQVLLSETQKPPAKLKRFKPHRNLCNICTKLLTEANDLLMGKRSTRYPQAGQALILPENYLDWV